MAIIGIDLGGTKIAAALFADSGVMKKKIVRLLNGATGHAVGKLIVETIGEFQQNENDEVIAAVGICVPGIVYHRKGTVWAPNIPGWDNYPLKQQIVNEFPHLVVNIESDRTCYILGEIWKGAAQGCDNAIYLAVGTGIGAGIILDGHIVHGANDIIGATGWMALQAPYTEEYDACGCFETYASGNGIGFQARKLLYQSNNYTGILSGKPIEEITSHDVFSAYNEQDPLATQVLDKAIEMWGMATANLVSLFNPEKVIFGGGVFGPAIGFIPRIYAEACKWGQPISMKQVEFCASKVEGEAALYGAAYLALRSLIHRTIQNESIL
jgi:glucokinase